MCAEVQSDGAFFFFDWIFCFTLSGNVVGWNIRSSFESLTVYSFVQKFTSLSLLIQSVECDPMHVNAVSSNQSQMKHTYENNAKINTITE